MSIYVEAAQLQTFQSIDEMNITIRKFLYQYGHKINESAKTVLLTISKYACKAKGVSWLGVPELIRLTGYSDRTIRRATDALARYGIVMKKPRFRTTKQKGQGSNFYIIQPMNGLGDLPAERPQDKHDRAVVTGRSNPEKPYYSKNKQCSKRSETKSFKAWYKNKYINKQHSNSSNPKYDFFYELFPGLKDKKQSQEKKYDVFYQLYNNKSPETN